MLWHSKKCVKRKTAKYIGLKIKPVKIETCDECASGKSKQKNSSRKSIHKPESNKGERIYIDIETLRNPKT